MVVVVLVLAGCEAKQEVQAQKVETPVDVDTGKSEVPAKPVAAAEPAQVDSGRSSEEIEALVKALGNQKVVSAKLISGRTLSSKIRFDDGGKAVFKPLRRYKKSAKREVAVFRIARFLGIHSIPVSTMREVSLNLLVNHIKKTKPEEAEKLLKTADVNSKGLVQGAVIEWVADLDPDGYKKAGGKKALQEMVFPARPHGDEPALAIQMSNMIVLDYLTGNWDRFSGGNVYLSKSGDLVLLDHNGTFALWSDKQRDKMELLLKGTERFSKSMFERIQKLDKKQVESALLEDAWHKDNRLVTEAEMNILLKRRDEIVSHINALIKRTGQDAVLPFI